MTGKWLLKERPLLHQDMMGAWEKLQASTLLLLLLPYARSQGPRDFIRRRPWDYPNAVLFLFISEITLFIQRQLGARPALPSSTSPAPKHTPAASHCADCSMQAYRASPATHPASLTVPKWQKDIQKMKPGGGKGNKKEKSNRCLEKEENARWERKEGGWLEITMVQLAPWSLSIFSAEKGVVLGCNLSLSAPCFRMSWLRHLT